MNILFSCIGRRGYIAEYFRPYMESGKIIGTSNSIWTPALGSCDVSYLLPDIESDEYIETVISICRKENISAILSFYDLDLFRLSEFKASFESIGIKGFISDFESCRICFDKFSMYSFLKKNDIAAPLTFVDTKEANDAIDRKLMNFPVIIKPRRGFASKNVFYANNPIEAERIFRHYPDMIIQELIKLPEYHLDILVDTNGSVISVVPKKKILMRSGETDQAVTTNNQELLDFGAKLGEKLAETGHCGPLDVDIFYSQDIICVIDLNPRFGGAYPLSHLAGADFPGKMIGMLKEQKIKPDIGNYKTGIFMMKEYRIIGGNEKNISQGIINLRK